MESKLCRARIALLVSLAASVLQACRSETDSDAHAAAPAQPSSVAAETRPDPRETPVAKKTKSTELVLPEQPGWVREKPSSTMRKAQFTLPRAEGDAADASLVVYYFGAGGGGGREANLERWASQFEQPDGTASTDRLASSTRKVGDLEVLDAEIEGTYVAETSPGSGTRVREPGWRMIASIVETDHGPYYVKLVGPAATVGHWEPSYRRMIGAATTR